MYIELATEDFGPVIVNYDAILMVARRVNDRSIMRLADGTQLHLAEKYEDIFKTLPIVIIRHNGKGKKVS